MALYLVLRTDCISYDEYDGAVISAESPSHALAIARENLSGAVTAYGFHEDNTVVEEILNTVGYGVLLGSFNAG
jgi:hypothetical protein